jgi:hypothetical protein
MDGITSAGKQDAVSGFARFARKSAIMGSTAIALTFAASAAQAQCTINADPILAGPLGTLAQLGTATANTIVSSILSVNTAFLTQSSAFIGSPPSPQANQWGGGTWARGIGGRLDVESTGSGTTNLGGTFSCAQKTRQDFAGFQVGQDLARLNLGNSGWNIHVGATGGYAESENKEPRSMTELRMEVPFVGVYAALTGGGGFFADAQVRWDFYHMVASNTTIGLFNQGFDARSVSVTGSAGYNYRLGNNWFIEPSVGVVHSNVKVDPLNVLVPTFPVQGVFNINDVESTLGRATLRAGTSVSLGRTILQPFGSIGVWHEFAGDATAGFTSTVSPIPFTAAINTTRVGTYGQYSLGVTGQVTNTGWLGYARVDLRKGENIEGVSMNGGLRYQFTPATRGALSAKY